MSNRFLYFGNKCDGLTLFELIIVLSIFSIVFMFAIPAQKNNFKEAVSKIMASQLLHAIYLARTEAIMKNSSVMLCHSRDQLTCSGQWEDGYIIYSEHEILYSFRNHLSRGKLYWRAFPQNRTYLQFLPSGALYAENGTFWYCEKGKITPEWAIVINQSGRARVVYSDAVMRSTVMRDTVMPACF